MNIVPINTQRLTLTYRDVDGRATEVSREFHGAHVSEAVDFCADALVVFGWQRESILLAMTEVDK